MRQQYITGGPERRARVRYSHRLPTSCRPLGKEAVHWSAAIENLSHTGMALRMTQEVRPGTVLLVELEGLGEQFSRQMLMRVQHIRPSSTQVWLVGCSFVKPLSDDDVQMLLLAKSSG